MRTVSKTVLLNNCAALGCNILVYDTNENALDLIKSIAAEGNIVVPKKNVVDMMAVIKNTDLNSTDICAIFLTEEKDDNGLSGFDIAKTIHNTRNNIPIFMRLQDGRGINELNTEQRKMIAGSYSNSTPEELKSYTEKFLYGFYFPTRLVDIFTEAGTEILNSTFKGCEVREAKPFLVYDHFITTEYTSILPVQFSFGNGVLTLLIKEDSALTLISNGHTALDKEQTSNNHLNQLISEIMNLYWGRVRLSSERIYGCDYDRSPINIPLVVNHKKNYISFGNNTPQLCFRYVLLRDASILDPITIEFKMMFNSVLRATDFPDYKNTDIVCDDSSFFELF